MALSNVVKQILSHYLSLSLSYILRKRGKRLFREQSVSVHCCMRITQRPRRKKQIYVRPLKGLDHPRTKVPFVYIRWKGDGWFLLEQIAEHILHTTEHALHFRIWCAIASSISRNPEGHRIKGNKAPKRLQRCRLELLTHDEIKRQVLACGVRCSSPLRECPRMIDVQGARYVLSSYDSFGGRLIRLFEAIIQLCCHSMSDYEEEHNGKRDGQLTVGTTVTQWVKNGVLITPTALRPISNGQVSEEHRSKRRRGRRRNTKVTQKERFHVLAMQRYLCAGCKTSIGWRMENEEDNSGTIVPFEIDHKLEFCRGGSSHVLNLQALCLNCHADKTRTYFQRPFAPYLVTPFE